MNHLQRRIAYFAFFAIFWKWLNPDAPWLQIALFFVIAFAIWQLRATVYKACLERLKPPIFVYLLDASCLLIGLGALDYLLDMHFLLWLDVPVAFGFALLSFFSYRKIRNQLLEAIARFQEMQQQQEHETVEQK